MRKRNIIPITFAASALVTVMVLSSAVGTAWAYFTTNTDATGRHVIRLAGEETTVEEKFSFIDWTKRVTVTNAEDSGYSVYVRARAYSGSQYPLSYSFSDADWTLREDGFYYYNGILEPGQSTPALNVEIKNVPEDKEDIKDASAFNVVIIYETTPVQYDSQGNPYEDWNLKLETGNVGDETEEGGNS